MSTCKTIASTGIACASLALLVSTGAPTFSDQVSDPAEASSSQELSEPDEATYELLQATYRSSTDVKPHIEHLPGANEATLWLARAVYSETKQPHEQELVAWVIRNRVDTAYRDQTTYEEVVLDPKQFSAFNPGMPKRAFYSNLQFDTPLSSWQHALHIAYYVQHADSSYRPFGIGTRHFFSQVSMPYHTFPHWADQRHKVRPEWNMQVDEWRFRFYSDLS